MSTITSSLFNIPGNCWGVEKATYASILVDCANYYLALHESICKARRSIFVLGWDIDSRIELLRGESAKHTDCPSKFFDLIQWKAQQHPDLMIYLNRWDYSLYLAAEREGFSKIRWYFNSPPNVHYCLDKVVPVGACHHQKVVVIDDEIAFCGGMDIALGRWDQRQHYPKNRHRADPGGTYNPKTCKTFGPYHDIQMLVAGPAAQKLAELARKRWYRATDYMPVPLYDYTEETLPFVWPESTKPQFQQVNTGIALTDPPHDDEAAIRQVEQLYLDMTARAERFIYMENQFFTQQAIARALNKRLHEKPELQLLLLSCYDPKGILERKAMWNGRVHFRDMLEEGGVANRVLMAYPISHQQDKIEPVRIHSKIMIVDDRYVRVGSSNINNRSMILDTECDLTLEAEDEKTKEAIAAVRNDLIREHTGRSTEDIEKLIRHGESVDVFLDDIPHSRQHLRRIDDEQYRDEAFASFISHLADPKPPMPPKKLPIPYYNSGLTITMLVRMLLAIMLIAGLVMVWKITPLSEYASAEKIQWLFEQLRHTSWAIPATLATYVLGGMVFFPLTILIAATAITFGPVQGFFIAMAGSLLSASLGFLIGRKLDLRFLRMFLGLYAEKISYYIKKGGVIGITLLRMIPIAPFTAVNVALGITPVSFPLFLAGTCLGLLPGIVAFSLLGDALVTLWQQPNWKHWLYALLGFSLWISVVMSAHLLVRHFYGHANFIGKG